MNELLCSAGSHVSSFFVFEEGRKDRIPVGGDSESHVREFLHN